MQGVSNSLFILHKNQINLVQIQCLSIVGKKSSQIDTNQNSISFRTWCNTEVSAFHLWPRYPQAITLDRILMQYCDHTNDRYYENYVSLVIFTTKENCMAFGFKAKNKQNFIRGKTSKQNMFRKF